MYSVKKVKHYCVVHYCIIIILSIKLIKMCINYRYSVGLGGFSGNKNSKAIQINERLDLSNYQFDHHKLKSDARPLRYHLVSMVIHYGSSLNSGHYTALGLTPSGSYYYFNDSNVCILFIIFYKIELIVNYKFY